jgi:dihydrofolate reductase
MTGSSTRIAFVVAVADNGVIGKDSAIPWHVSSDLKFFRAITMGKPIIMGRKTYDSIGKPLDGRDNIVVTRNPDFQADGVLAVSSLEDALDLGRSRAKERGATEICVIGGGEIFDRLLAWADVIYLTEIHMSSEGDTFFPALDSSEWRELSRERHAAGPKDDADYSIVIMERHGSA